MGICSPGSLPLYIVMFDAMLLSDLANKFFLSLSLLPNPAKQFQATTGSHIVTAPR